MNDPPRVLFVDDEPRVLSGLQRMLFECEDIWDMDFVPSGQAALDAMAVRPYDALVTDMLMPTMSGAQLLKAVHSRYPGTVRFVLSGQADAEATLQAMEIAHQFLTKPCAPERLVQTLQQAWELDTVLAEPRLRSLVASVVQLPSRPAVYSELCRELANPNSTASKVALIVETDAAVASRLLRLVNSAAYGARRQTRSVAQAVVRLGNRNLKSLVLTCGAGSAFAGVKPMGALSVESINHRSVLIGRGARYLLGGQGAMADEAFLVGLLHQVGLLILIGSRREEYRRVLALSEGSGRPVLDCEAGVLGATHPVIGAYVLNLWGLSYSLIDAVAKASFPGLLEGRTLDPAVAVATARLALRGGPEDAKVAEYVLGIATGDFRELVTWMRANDGG